MTEPAENCKGLIAILRRFRPSEKPAGLFSRPVILFVEFGSILTGVTLLLPNREVKLHISNSAIVILPTVWETGRAKMTIARCTAANPAIAI